MINFNINPRMDEEEDPFGSPIPEKPFYDWEDDPDYTTKQCVSGLVRVLEMRRAHPVADLSEGNIAA